MYDILNVINFLTHHRGRVAIFTMLIFSASIFLNPIQFAAADDMMIQHECTDIEWIGTITDSEENPLSDVRVGTIKKMSTSSIEESFYTDENGLVSIPSSLYTGFIKISKGGFNDKKIVLDCKFSQVDNVSSESQKPEIYSIPEISSMVEINYPACKVQNGFDSITKSGEQYFFDRNYEGSLVCYTNAVDIKPQYIFGFTRIADSYYYLGQHQDTIAIYNKILEINPNFDIVNKLWLYNNWLHNDEKHDEQIIYLDKILEVEPNYVDGIISKSVALEKLGRYDEAEMHIQKYLKINSDSDNLKNRLMSMQTIPFRDNILSFDRSEEFEKSLLEYEKLIAINPDFVNDVFNRAFELYESGDLVNALSYYNKVLDYDPNHIDALNNKGVILKDLGQVDDAIEYFNKSLEIDPNYKTAIYNIAFNLAYLERYDEATQHLDKLVELDPNHIDAIYNQGHYHIEENNFKAANFYFDNVLRHSPNDTDVLYNNGFVLATLGKYEESLLYYDKVIELNPKATDALLNKGWVLNELGKHEKAVEYYDKVLEINPEYEQAMFNKEFAEAGFRTNSGLYENQNPYFTIVPPTDWYVWDPPASDTEIASFLIGFVLGDSEFEYLPPSMIIVSIDPEAFPTANVYSELEKYGESNIKFNKDAELFWLNVWDLEDIASVLTGTYKKNEITDLRFEMVDDHFELIMDATFYENTLDVNIPMKIIWLAYESENYILAYFADPDNFEMYQNDFLISSSTISFEQTDQTFNEMESVPSWIKNNAGWWADGQIDDASFIQGIQFLIQQNTLEIPDSVNDKIAKNSSDSIPSWIKNNAGWWSEGLISDKDFLKGIQFLIESNMIQINQ